MFNPMTRIAGVLTVLVTAVLATGCSGGSGSRVGPPPPPPPPPPANVTVLDLASVSTGSDFARITGAASTGIYGVPVAGGHDCDNDGHLDLAMSAMLATPLGRSNAGQVHLVFGDGTVTQNLDSALAGDTNLIIAGTGPDEVTGSEIWMADVTGDGIGDLLIGRQNYREPVSGRIGAGALSIVIGGNQLRDLARDGTILDLAAPPAGIEVATVVGAAQLDRFGIWFRTGDVTGDGIDDIVVGADQEDGNAENNRGAAWLIRGGTHLNATFAADLAEFGATPLAGHILRIEPPAMAENYHFGATVALADLDNNLRHDIVIAASLSRAGAQLTADGAPDGSAVRNGGNPGGSLFILWDDNIGTGPVWPAGLTLEFDQAPGSTTRIDGGTGNSLFTSLRFGEDVIGGADYNGDGEADLFAGDIKGTSLDRSESGIGHVIFSAANLRDRAFDMDAIPAEISVTHILGVAAGTISGDTSLHGDIDGDGITDLAISSPLASPLGRDLAGIIHVLWGQGTWPATIDLRDDARPANFAITDIYGAHGSTSISDAGDTLMYSAAAADLDGDGKADLIVNEMRGNNGAATDVGNLIVIGGARIPLPLTLGP